jgi:hypothetical protein
VEDKSSGDKRNTLTKDKDPKKKVSREIGEYVDYEDIKK